MDFDDVPGPRAGDDRWMPHQTERGVAFYADRIPPRCLKCGAADPPWRSRTLRVGARAGFHAMGIRSMAVKLPICGRCALRWALAPWLAIVAFVLPFAIIAGTVMVVHEGRDQAFGVLIMGALLAPIPPLLLAWRWALRVASIDDDGMIELRGVPRAVAAEIVDQATAITPPQPLPAARVVP
jgi:hypothetical protein